MTGEPRAPAPLLAVDGLDVRYGAATALRGATLVVQPRQLVAVIGNNGAGKTSLLRGLTGLVRPSAGRVRFKGEETGHLPAHAKVARGLVMVPEGRLLFLDQSVEDNLILGAYVHGGLKSLRARASLDRVLTLFPRLRERLGQPAGSLSGGEQQMLAIGRGLMAEPDLLVIDELSLGLAPKVIERLICVLRDLNREGLAILLVEQLASYALAIADHAYVLANGRIVREGPSAGIARDPEVMESFLGKRPPEVEPAPQTHPDRRSAADGRTTRTQPCPSASSTSASSSRTTCRPISSFSGQ